MQIKMSRHSCSVWPVQGVCFMSISVWIAIKWKVFVHLPPKSQGLLSHKCAFIWNTICCITMHIFNKTRQLRNIPKSSNLEIRQLCSNETHYSHEYTLGFKTLKQTFFNNSISFPIFCASRLMDITKLG